jgi:hypothetical protein
MANLRYGTSLAYGFLACSVNWYDMTGVGAGNGCYTILTKESLDIMSLSSDIRMKCGSAATDFIHLQQISNETNGSAVDIATFGGEEKKATFYGQINSQLASSGGAPFVIASTGACTNLNADLLDGYHRANLHGSLAKIEYATRSITLNGGSPSTGSGSVVFLSCGSANTMTLVNLRANSATQARIGSWASISTYEADENNSYVTIYLYDVNANSSTYTVDVMGVWTG